MQQRPIIIPLADLRARAEHRPPDYLATVLAAGVVKGEDLHLTEAAHRQLVSRFQGPALEWPSWALVAALFAIDTDRGLGDTLKRELGGVKNERFKRWHESIFGLWVAPCGCGKIEEWNGVFPYAPVQGDLNHP